VSAASLWDLLAVRVASRRSGGFSGLTVIVAVSLELSTLSEASSSRT